jgi:hypothetical protein
MYKFSSQERIPEPEEYDYLDEANMISAAKLNVFLPPEGDDSKKQEDRRASSASGRYSKWPLGKIFLYVLFVYFAHWPRSRTTSNDCLRELTSKLIARFSRISFFLRKNFGYMVVSPSVCPVC